MQFTYISNASERKSININLLPVPGVPPNNAHDTKTLHIHITHTNHIYNKTSLGLFFSYLKCKTIAPDCRRDVRKLLRQYRFFDKYATHLLHNLLK